MKQAISLIAGLVFLLVALWCALEFSPGASAQPRLQTDRAGTISADETWTLASSPYTLTADVLVAEGVTLTIEPGVEIRSQGAELTIQGNLVATGTTSQTITFTSAVSRAESWKGLVFDGGTGTLNHVIVRYGSMSNSLDRLAAITVVNVSGNGVMIENSSIENSFARGLPGKDVSDFGLYVENSIVTVKDTTFKENGFLGADPEEDFALAVSGSQAQLTLDGVTFDANQQDRVLILDNATVIADDSGDGDIILAPQNGLEGYQLRETYTVPDGKTLAVQAGTTVLAENQAELTVLGTINVNGTQSKPVLVRHVNSECTGGQWKGLVIDNGGTGTLRYMLIRCGGVYNSLETWSNIAIRNAGDAGVHIFNSIVRDEAGLGTRETDQGLYIENSTVEIKDSTFHNNGIYEKDYAILVTGDSSNVTINASTLRGKTINETRDGLGVWGGTVTVTNCTRIQNFRMGMYMSAGTASVWNTAFTSFNNHAIWLWQGGKLSVHNSAIANAPNGNLVFNEKSSLVSAEENWWGSDTGPTILSTTDLGAVRSEPNAVNTVYVSIDPFLTANPFLTACDATKYVSQDPGLDPGQDPNAGAGMDDTGGNLKLYIPLIRYES